MTLKRQIAHNAIIQLSGKFIGTFFGLLTVLIMVRGLGAEKFGWYTTAIGFLQFVGIFSDFGFMITTANMMAEPNFDKEKLLNTLFTWRLLTAAIFQGLSPLIFLFFPYPIEVKIAVAVTAISFFAIGVGHVFNGYFQQQLKTHIITAGEFIGRILLLISVFLLTKYHLGFVWIMTAITVSSIFNILYLFYKMPKLHFCFDKEITKAIFTKISPTALCIIFNSFYLQGDRVILPLYVSQTQVGFYGASYRVLDIIVQIAAMVMGIMSPLLAYFYSRSLKEEFKQHLQMSFDMMALVLIPMMVGAYSLAEPIMRFVGGNEFMGAGKILVWLSWTILGICFGIVFGYTSLAINRQRQAVWIYAIDAALSIIGYFYFIPRYGIFGAAGVTIFSEVFAGLGLMSLVIYHTHFIPQLKAIFKIFISAFIMYLAIFFYNAPHVLFSIALGGIVYIMMILLLKTISTKTFKEVYQLKN